MPENTVYVGRGSKWGNIYKVVNVNVAGVAPRWQLYNTVHKTYFGEYFTKEQAIWDSIHLYRYYLIDKLVLTDLNLAGLKGKDLACWCALDKPCHADVLIKLVNKLYDNAT